MMLRSIARGPKLHLVMSLLVLFITSLLLSSLTTTSSSEAAEGTPPNIVFIMIDDVGPGYLDAMPGVQESIREPGVQFDHGVIPTSLCCPSRASTLTGNYAHTTDVYGNGTFHGGWSTFQGLENDTLATRLSGQGYRTALFGKYLNGFAAAPADYVPAGWDEFEVFDKPRYYNYTLRGTTRRDYGSDPSDYSTDVLSARATRFLQETPADQPFFLMYAPYAAHTPFVPAPRHRGTWHREQLPASFNETFDSSKPAWHAKKRSMSRAVARDEQQRRHEMLMSVDEGVQEILNELGPRLDNTMVVLMADNGWMDGAHRFYPKDTPYRRSVEVPMLLRWDGHVTADLATRMTLNIDLTATIAEAAQIPNWNIDGKSVLSTGRGGTVLEQMSSKRSIADDNMRGNKWHPSYCGYRTPDWMYVKWDSAPKQRGQELYYYPNDPEELNNLAKLAEYKPTLREMRKSAMDSCTPTPPGFDWSKS